MKKGIIISAITLIAILAQNCKTKTYVPQYNWPEGASEAQIEEYAEMAEVGLREYKKYCGTCHGITHKGKSSIPNFSKNELRDYNLRWHMNNSDTHGRLEDLSDNQLACIIIFLDYREKTEE